MQVLRHLTMKIMEVTALCDCYTIVAVTQMPLAIGTQADA